MSWWLNLRAVSFFEMYGFEDMGLPENVGNELLPWGLDQSRLAVLSISRHRTRRKGVSKSIRFQASRLDHRAQTESAEGYQSAASEQ